MPKYSGWKNLPTTQSKEILAELKEAKEEQQHRMIIANTGYGKTNAISMFMTSKEMARHTYVFRLGDSWNLLALINEIQAALGFPINQNKNKKFIALRRIAKRLNEIADEGNKPMIILDESENCKVPTLKAIKELYDAVNSKCSLILIGTPQLTEQLNKTSNNQSVPQLKRRFKAGTRHITPFRKDKDMKIFFETFIPDNHDLRDLLIEICNNYGELHDYLDSFLIHCDKKNKAVTEENFRLYHKIPKH